MEKTLDQHNKEVTIKTHKQQSVRKNKETNNRGMHINDKTC